MSSNDRGVPSRGPDRHSISNLRIFLQTRFVGGIIPVKIGAGNLYTLCLAGSPGPLINHQKKGTPSLARELPRFY